MGWGRGGGGRGGGGRGRGGGGGGRGRGGGGGGGRGGGGQRWGDPAWRAQKLASMHANREPEVRVDEPMIMARLEELRRSAEQEVVWRDNFGRDGASYVLRLCSGVPGLYCKQYGKGRNTVLCVSKVPLPDYRADLDARFGKQQASVGMSSDGQEMVRSLLARTEPAQRHRQQQQQQRPASAPPRPDAAQAESEQARLARLARAERDAAAAEQPAAVADAWDDSGDDEDGSGSADEAVELAAEVELAGVVCIVCSSEGAMVCLR